MSDQMVSTGIANVTGVGPGGGSVRGAFRGCDHGHGIHDTAPLDRRSIRHRAIRAKGPRSST
jgi:hypothetical protein